MIAFKDKLRFFVIKKYLEISTKKNSQFKSPNKFIRLNLPENDHRHTVSENCPLIHRIMMLRWRVGIAVNQMIKCFNCLFRIKRWETLGLNTQTLLSHTLKHTSSRLIYYTLIPLMKFRFRSKNGIREELVCVVIVVRFRENGWTSKRERCVCC